MRLRPDQIEIFKNAVYLVDPKADIFLFGSRVDDKKKGGDIDLLIISEKKSLSDKLKIRRELFKKIEDQKIDIYITNNLNDPFVKVILRDAIKL